MKFSSYFNKILSFLPFLDIYERKVQLSIDSKGGIKSKIGGIFSVFLIGVALYSFINNFQSWINGEQLRMISRYDSLTVDEISRKNPSLLFEWDNSNYDIYFEISSKIDLYSKPLYNEDLQRYITFSLLYFDVDSMHPRNLEWENCSYSKMEEFLQLEEKSHNDKTFSTRICIKDGQNFKFGYATDQQIGRLNMTQLLFVIEKCVNSSSNNFSCAPEEEIIDIIRMAHIQISLPKSYYDFNNVVNTRKRSFDYQYYYLDPNVLHSYSNNIIPIFLSTDHGLINTDYKLDSVDFNSEALSYQALSAEMNSGALFLYSIKPSLNQQYYYRKNENIFWLFSSLGGTINFFFFFGNIFIYFYNSLILKHRLIDISFSSNENKKVTQTEQNIGVSENKSQEENKIKFSFFNLICPNFFKNTEYTEALKNIQEYMDIKNIVRRLQELDKIKMILFDEKGLQDFENLPKPIAKTKKNAIETLISSQPQISEAIEKSLYLKSVRSIMNMNENTRKSSLHQLKNFVDLENQQFLRQNLKIYEDSERKEFIKEMDVPEEKQKEKGAIELRAFTSKEKIELNYKQK